MTPPTEVRVVCKSCGFILVTLETMRHSLVLKAAQVVDRKALFAIFIVYSFDGDGFHLLWSIEQFFSTVEVFCVEGFPVSQRYDMRQPLVTQQLIRAFTVSGRHIRVLLLLLLLLSSD